jgi:hypothetical protein
MRNILMTTLALVGVALFTLGGCGKAPAPAGDGEAGHAEHDHEAMGPHDGHIIELGTEDYHAELSHDEASHKVGIYLLGGDAKTAKPIPVTEVKIKVSADGAFSEYVLPAVPQAGEEGGSSYFEVVSEPLCDVVCGESEAENTQARLSFDMDGKPFVGMIETAAHEHDHEHGHAH